MTAFKAAVTGLLRHPSALLAGIIVTFVVALLTLIPAADEYSALRERSAEVSNLLQQGIQDRDELGQIRQDQRKLQEELTAATARAVDEEGAHRLRESLVEFSRQSDCHLRRVDLGPVRVRQWREGDHPVNAGNNGARGEKTEFLLEVRELRLTLSGGIEQIKRFMQEFETLDVQMNVQQANVRAVDASGDQVQLELVLQLFGIKRAEKEELLKS